MTSDFTEGFYDDYPRIEEAFQAALDESLHPRGPDLLYEIVGDLNMPPGARVVDLGCGEGQHSIQLAQRFDVAVHGIDPEPRHMELANEALAEAAKTEPELGKRVRFDLGVAEAMPVEDVSVDLVWCREVLYHVAALDEAFAECRRVLRAGGRMLIYHNFDTDRMEPREAEWLWRGQNVVPANQDPRRVELAFAGAGLQIEQFFELGSEFGEYAQETNGKAGRSLIHAARLLRDPQRYIAQFGQENYDIMLGDCFWHVNRMLGKLSSRVYVLKAPGGA